MLIRDTEYFADIKSRNWLQTGNLKRETESLITSDQDQFIRTNNIKTKIDGPRNEPKCRMCKVNDETITHIISECSKRLQKEYKHRHDWIEKTVHWYIFGKKNLMLPQNGRNANLYLVQKMNFLKFSWTLIISASFSPINF